MKFNQINPHDERLAYVLFMPHPLSDTILQAGLETLLTQMERLTDQAVSGSAINPAEFEKLAKAISAHLKTMDDVIAYDRRQRDLDTPKSYTAYADFPPPSPEERAEILERLQKLYAKMDIGAALTRALERDRPK